MNTEDVRFVVAWMLSPSLEAASAVLGIGQGCVIRRAEQMRAAGVPLKDLADMQVSPLAEATSNGVKSEASVEPDVSRAVPSYISQLKAGAQMRFYSRYTVPRNGGQSLAESVANHYALKSGDIGRVGIASGVVEDAAFEAIAQLAVAPPPGFDPSHPKAEGYVVRHVGHAVRARLCREYGWQGRRYCVGVSTKVGQGAVTVPSAHGDDEIAQAKAHEVVRARQLERVRAVLPGGLIPTNRAGRMALLRAFGEGKTQAVTNAAEHRFYGVLAQYIRAELELDARRYPNDTGEQESSVEESIQAPDEHIEKPQLKPSAFEVPESIRQRLVPAASKSREQRRAERFVVAWQTSSSAREAATRLGKPVKSVTAYARRLRMLGVTCLKTLPTSPGPLVRGARALIPSAN